MCRVSTGNRKYNLKKLKPVHRQIIARLCWGVRPKQITLELGVSKNTISNAKCSPIGQQLIAEMDNQIELLSFSKVHTFKTRKARHAAHYRLKRDFISAVDFPYATKYIFGKD